MGHLTVATQAIEIEHFMNGRFHFKPTDQATVGEVSSQGVIIANEKQGFVVLAGAGNVSNNGSLMETQGGVHMVLAQAFKLTLPSGSNPFLNVELAGVVRRPVDLVCPMEGGLRLPILSCKPAKVGVGTVALSKPSLF